MKVALQCLLLAGLLAGPAHGQEKPKEENPYFPLKEGAVWSYKTSAGQKVTVKVAGFEKKGEDVCAKLEWRRGTDLVSTEFIAVRKDGVYRTEFAGGKVDPALPFLKSQGDATRAPKPGENWTFKSKIDGKDEVTGSFVTGEAKGVKVPSGTYDTVTVTSKELKIDNQAVVITYYFAPKVGLVKQIVDIGGTKTELELEKYEEKEKK